MYVEGTPLAHEAGVSGYYIRIAPELPQTEGPDVHAQVQVRNHEAGSGSVSADTLISTDALALVRFGLRAPDDPRILDTITVIDRLLKVDLPQGPGWRRYNLDGYGEKADGRPFDGVGVGRAWPLLAGERAHYALAAGRRAEAEALLATIEAQTSPGGLFPEQVWDGAPIASRELAPGQPTGSAMPWCGPMPSISNCYARWRMASSSTCRRIRCGAMSRPSGARAAGPGAPIARSPEFGGTSVARGSASSCDRSAHGRRLADASRNGHARHRRQRPRGGNTNPMHGGRPAHRVHLARSGLRDLARTQPRSRYHELRPIFCPEPSVADVRAWASPTGQEIYFRNMAPMKCPAPGGHRRGALQRAQGPMGTSTPRV